VVKLIVQLSPSLQEFAYAPSSVGQSLYLLDLVSAPEFKLPLLFFKPGFLSLGLGMGFFFFFLRLFEAPLAPSLLSEGKAPLGIFEQP